jgi:hypothetical protein
MVDLKTELDDGLPDIMGAEHETRQSGSADAADRVLIEVSDTGIGMDEDTTALP